MSDGIQTAFAPPAAFSIGSVPYLNAKPLVHALPGGIRYLHPTELTRVFGRGELDVALLPTAACLENPTIRIIEGLAIASDGPVYSVVLALRKPLKELRSIALDSASKTSANLVKVLADRHFKICPEYVPEGAPADAELWIGDQAIRFRRDNPSVPVVDLGQAWKEFCGLPFVYAVWAVAPGSKMTAEDIGQFRRLSRAGLDHRREIARDAGEFDYLTNHIRYLTGEPEKRGIARFALELQQMGLVPKLDLPRFV